MAVSAGPRIYTLFPLLFGPVKRWSEQLPRIGAMGFDWVHLNPFHLTGSAGNLYAVKDHAQLHPLFRGDDQRPDDEIIAAFVREAQAYGLRVMMDLVIGQTARESRLEQAHPDWFLRDPAGSFKKAAAPDEDARDYGGERAAGADVALLDYTGPAARRSLVAFWSDYLDRHIALGIDGFRCDAAWKVPAEVWQALIETARAFAPRAVFVADVAAAGVAEAQALRPAGFDFLLNPSRWWDFRSDWLLDRYETLRHVAPSISFPEGHDTPRVVAEVGAGEAHRLAEHARLRYLFAAGFSSGVMMPAGYEYGFSRRLDAVRTRPDDWESPRFDISSHIAAVNAMKASLPALNEEGPQARVTAPRAAAVGLLRHTEARSSCALTLINPDPREAHAVDAGMLLAASGGIYQPLVDVTPEREPWTFAPGAPLELAPLEVRILARRAARRRRPPAPAPQRGLQRGAAARAGSPPRHDRGGLAGAQWRPPSGQALRRRRAGGMGRHLLRRPRADRGGSSSTASGRDRLRETPMVHFDNDRWAAAFPSPRTRLVYTIEAWRDLFAAWRERVRRRSAMPGRT